MSKYRRILKRTPRAALTIEQMVEFLKTFWDVLIIDHDLSSITVMTDRNCTFFRSQLYGWDVVDEEHSPWNWSQPDITSPPKQWIIIRKDLNMRLGKAVAQGSHASLGAILKYLRLINATDQFGNQWSNACSTYWHNEVPGKARARALWDWGLDKRHEWGESVQQWLEGSFTKITLFAHSEAELMTIHDQAVAAGLLTCLIRDSGKTEFKGVPTYTALAIGPTTVEKGKAIVGHLKLA